MGLNSFSIGQQLKPLGEARKRVVQTRRSLKRLPDAPRAGLIAE